MDKYMDKLHGYNDNNKYLDFHHVFPTIFKLKNMCV